MQLVHETLAGVVRLVATIHRPRDFYTTGTETSLSRIE